VLSADSSRSWHRDTNATTKAQFGGVIPRGHGRMPAGVIGHPQKVLFPEDGITKGELAAYYERVAPLMLPHMSRRPVTMERFPSGIGQPGFLQKSVSRGFPEWLERVEVPKIAPTRGSGTPAGGSRSRRDGRGSCCCGWRRARPWRSLLPTSATGSWPSCATGREGPRRDDDNAAVAWLHVTGKRLGVLLARALPEAETGWDEVVALDRQTGQVSLRADLVVSDVQAFVSAATRAVEPTLTPAERRAAAEETLALGLPVLGDDSPRPDDLPKQVQERVGSVVPAYGWARQDAWERDAPAFLLALWRDAVLSLARAYRDSGQHPAAVNVYGMLLDQDPQLANAQQGLLLAAAGTDDPARLEAAWRRVRVAWDGDVPDDVRELHEELRREVAAHGTSR
jgi:hypothetical protein